MPETRWTMSKAFLLCSDPSFLGTSGGTSMSFTMCGCSSASKKARDMSALTSGVPRCSPSSVSSSRCTKEWWPAVPETSASRREHMREVGHRCEAYQYRSLGRQPCQHFPDYLRTL